jgi:hypothetical protein
MMGPIYRLGKTGNLADNMAGGALEVANEELLCKYRLSLTAAPVMLDFAYSQLGYGGCNKAMTLSSMFLCQDGCGSSLPVATR